MPITVNSRYSGHPRDHDLVSVIAGCVKIFILNHIYRRGSQVCSFSLTPVLFQTCCRTQRASELYLQTEELNRTGVTYPLCTVLSTQKQSSYVAAMSIIVLVSYCTEVQ